jgi:hypothetical protein
VAQEAEERVYPLRGSGIGCERGGDYKGAPDHHDGQAQRPDSPTQVAHFGDEYHISVLKSRVGHGIEVLR